jgi:hypothetical protein
MSQIYAVLKQDICHKGRMTDISYRVVPRGKSGFDVEMDKPDGRKQTVPGFRSEHEADAWIVQAKRMIRDAGPWTPLAPRKPVPVAAEAVKSPSPPKTDPPPRTAQTTAQEVGSEESGAQGAGTRVATPRARTRPVRERSQAQG